MDNASTTTSGASNASDFQPPTQNPQTASPNLQTTGQELQPLSGNSNERLNQLPATPLTVETVQSNTTSQVSQISKSGLADTLTGLLPFLVALIIAIWLFRRWNLFSPKVAMVQSATPEDLPETVVREKSAKKTIKKPTNSRPKKKTKTKR